LSNKYFASCIALLAALAPDTAAAAARDSYPSRPIRLVVPYSPGGPADVLSRMVGDKLAPRLKQPVVIDNRPGAGGHVGGEQVAKGTPDGYTLVLNKKVERSDRRRRSYG
jgi:tripartite-type tricarboxylate transporter receptor subunit TctC